MALRCAHCNGRDFSHGTQTAFCLMCGGETFYDGTPGDTHDDSQGKGE